MGYVPPPIPCPAFEDHLAPLPPRRCADCGALARRKGLRMNTEREFLEVDSCDDCDFRLLQKMAKHFHLTVVEALILRWDERASWSGA